MGAAAFRTFLQMGFRIFVAAVEAAMIDVMKVLCDEMQFTPAEITKS